MSRNVLVVEARVAAVGVLAAAKWLFGWFVPATDADAPALDDVQCTVFAPPAAAPGSSVLVQVLSSTYKGTSGICFTVSRRP